MFLSLQRLEWDWQSADGHAGGGTAQLAGRAVCFLWLGPRPATRGDVLGLSGSLKRFLLMESRPLLLLSECPGLAADPAAEAAGLIEEAGAYRRLQQEWKALGRPLVSVVHEIAVGGTYLLHGLAAPDRFATERTVFYGGLPPGQARQVMGAAFDLKAATVEEAAAAGLVTAIVSLDELETGLSKALSNG